MKRLLFFITTIIVVTFMVSCDKEEKEPVLDMSQTVKPAITSPATGLVFVLLQDSADSMFPAFAWSAADYNLKTIESTKYILQMDVEGGNFANAVDLVSSGDLMFELTVSAMNQKLIALGVNPDTAKNVEFRVRSYVNDASSYTNIYSATTTVTVTTYKESGGTDYPMLYMPGGYQGWSPATAPNVYDFDGDGVYTGYLLIPADATSFEFKFTSDPDWDHTNYGFATEGTLSTDPGATNLVLPGVGGYFVTIDINNLTWTYELQNWGVIGEWLAWAEDINMEWDATNKYLFATVENIPAAANQRFKFRANDAWDLNYGAKDPDDGTLTPGGADIPIPDGGTLTFVLKFSTPEPSYQVIAK